MTIIGARWSDWVEAIASVATAVGVFLACWQIWLTKLQARTVFEDSLAREYRDLAQRLPIGALLGETLSEAEQRNALDDFFHYIDLSNEQVFLRMKKRVSRDTWLNWRDGIRSNLSRPAFHAAWEEVRARSQGSFSELRRLET